MHAPIINSLPVVDSDSMAIQQAWIHSGSSIPAVTAASLSQFAAAAAAS
jgi:hypothetical protein